MSIHSMGLWHAPKRFPLSLTLSMSMALLGGGITGCSDAPRPPTAEAKLPVSIPQQQPQPQPVIADGARVSVDQILELAVRHNPNQDVFAATRAAAEAEVQIAHAWANPELELTGGQGRSRDGAGNETIYGGSLRQRLELPGKRSARIAVARAGQAATDYEIAIDRLALETSVRAACLELAAAEAALVLEQNAFAAAETMYAAIQRLQQVKEVEPGEYSRAKLEQLTATIARERAERQVTGLRAAVRVWTGGGLPESFIMTSDLAEALPAIDRQVVLTLAADRNPRLALLRSRMDVRTAELARERRAWQPDVTVGVFSGHDFDTDNLGLSLGFEVPLWNRNQGGISLANAQQRAALGQCHAEQWLVARDVELAWQRYDSRRLALGSAVRDTAAAAQAAVDAQLAGLAVGETSLIAVLEARRAARVVDQFIFEARLAAAEARLALGQAIGSFALPPIASAGEQP